MAVEATGDAIKVLDMPINLNNARFCASTNQIETENETKIIQIKNRNSATRIADLNNGCGLFNLWYKNNVVDELNWSSLLKITLD